MIKVLMLIMYCNTNNVCTPAMAIEDTPLEVCMQIRRDMAPTKVFCVPEGQQS